MAEVQRCKCGHNFYQDEPVRDGLCTYCVEEMENPQRCCICGKPATCNNEGRYLCDDKDCRRSIEISDDIAWDLAHPDLAGP